MSPRAAPGPPPVSASFTGLYFQLLAPLLAATALWSTSLFMHPNYLVVLPLCVPLLFVGLAYPWIPPRLEWGVRLSLTGLHLLLL